MLELSDEHADSGKSVRDILNDQMIEDLENFEGNAQVFRILTKARYQSEINLPFSIMSALVKYPTKSTEREESITIRHKTGYYLSEEDCFMQIAEEVGTVDPSGRVIRHPLAYLVEAADDIAYRTADLEDAVKAGVISVDELISYFKHNYTSLGEERAENQIHINCTKEIIDKLDYSLNQEEKDKTKVMSRWGTYLRRWLMYVTCWRFSKSYKEIMRGEFEHDLFYDNNHSLTVELLKQVMKDKVFNSRIILNIKSGEL